MIKWYTPIVILAMVAGFESSIIWFFHLQNGKKHITPQISLPFRLVRNAQEGQKIGQTPTGEPICLSLFRPDGIAINEDSSKIYVCELETGSVVEIDAASMEILRRIPVGKKPEQIVYVKHSIKSDKEKEGCSVNSEDYERLYITLSGSNAVAMVELLKGYEKKEIPVGQNPFGIWLSKDEKTIFVGNSDVRSNSISIIDVSESKLIGGPKDRRESLEEFVKSTSAKPNPALSRHKQQSLKTNYCSGAKKNSLSTGAQDSKTAVANTKKVKEIMIGLGPRIGTCTADNRYIIVPNFNENTVTVLDSRTYSKVKTIEVGNSPSSVAVEPSSNFAYVTNYKDDTISVIDLDNLEATVQTIVLVNDAHPMHIAIGYSGSGTPYGFIACRDTAEVAVLDLRTNCILGSIAMPIMQDLPNFRHGNPFMIAFGGTKKNLMFVSLHYQYQVANFDIASVVQNLEIARFANTIENNLLGPTFLGAAGLSAWALFLFVIYIVDPVALSYAVSWLEKTVCLPKPFNAQQSSIISSLLLWSADQPRVLKEWVQLKTKRIQASLLKEYSPDSLVDSSDLAFAKIAMNQPNYCLLVTGNDSKNTSSIVRGIVQEQLKDGNFDFIPVWIKNNIDPLEEFQFDSALPRTVEGYLENMLGENVKSLHVSKLLQQRKIIVIVDDFSNKSQRTQELIRFSSYNCIVNGLVVTSTDEHVMGKLGNIAKLKSKCFTN